MINEENVTVLTVYVPSNEASKYTSQNQKKKKKDRIKGRNKSTSTIVDSSLSDSLTFLSVQLIVHKDKMLVRI